ALDATAVGRDVDVAGDVADQATAAGVQGVEDAVLDGVGVGEGGAVDLERVTQRRHGVGAGVVDQLAGAVDVERVAARVGGGAEVQHAAGDADGRVAEAGRFLDDVVAQREAAAADQDGRCIPRGDEGRVGNDHIPGNDREGGRGRVDGRPALAVDVK